MKRLKGPELKMPQLKAPAFLTDLYYDLRDRRLLPLVALVLVAIVAAPFLLGNKSESVLAPPAAGLAEGLAGAPKSSLTVVEATPGLRDYRKRLRDRTPTDPFKQRYTGLPASAQLQSGASSVESSASAGASSGLGEGGSVETSETTVESGGQSPSSGGGSSGSGSSGGSGSGSNGSGGGKGKPHLVIFDYAIDARISYSPPPGADSAQQQEPFVKHRVLPQTPLPGEKAPVVTYLGPGRKQGDKATGKVLLAVSGDVSSIAGQHRCVSSARSGGICELLEVEPGFPLTFAYGQAGAHYTIKVLSIELVVTGHT
jgi:hypothetical protein